MLFNEALIEVFIKVIKFLLHFEWQILNINVRSLSVTRQSKAIADSRPRIIPQNCCLFVELLRWIQTVFLLFVLSIVDVLIKL